MADPPSSSSLGTLLGRSLQQHPRVVVAALAGATALAVAAYWRHQRSRRIQAARQHSTSAIEDDWILASHVRPYGSWVSPITSELITRNALRLAQATIVDGVLYWVEGRPSEQGRCVLVRQDGIHQGAVRRDVTPAPFNVRSKVHEYGGACYAVLDKETTVFCNAKDQALYKATVGAGEGQVTMTPLTAVGSPFRFAELIVDKARNRLVCLREDHTNAAPTAVVNDLCTVDLTTGTVARLISGHDFFLYPTLSPCGNFLAYICYDHPNMPWDRTVLCVATLDAQGSVHTTRIVAGAPDVDESIVQPRWAPNGVLYFITDRTGWYTIHREPRPGLVECVGRLDRDFAGPVWSVGVYKYDFIDSDTLLCSAAAPGAEHSLHVLDARSGKLVGTFADASVASVDTVSIDQKAKMAVVVGGSAVTSLSVVTVDVSVSPETPVGSSALHTVRKAFDLPLPITFLSQPELVEFPTEGGLTAYAYVYMPTNATHQGLAGELPPLLVKSHGGPTGAAPTILRLDIQYWTSRGFAVADVDYGGSSGYGRAYRDRLAGAWGIVDVADVCRCAQFLVAQGRVDGARLCIDGSSAGGFTTLAALAFHDVFRAGCSRYGVGDLEALALDTHKYEARYLDKLVGEYPAAKAVYMARSPLHHVDRLRCPILLQQGDEDAVVPMAQAKTMHQALLAKGIPTTLQVFAGEGHGFRAAESISRAIDSELVFFGRVLGFAPAGPLPVITIDNLPED